jgi:hypothetical protein
MDLAPCFGKPNPAHRAKIIASFPGPKNFLNSGANGSELAIARCEFFGRKPAMAFAQQFRASALGLDRLFHRTRIIALLWRINRLVTLIDEALRSHGSAGYGGLECGADGLVEAVR